MNVSVAIQHHPRRAHLIPRLVERLGGADVVTDPQPDAQASPWRTYRQAIVTTPGDATHRLIVQDDAEPCDGFRDRMLALVEERPDDILPLFVPGSTAHRAAMTRAAQAGERWALMPPTWIPLVATVWPVERARQMVEWVDAHYAKDPRGDDGVAGKWAQAARVRAWAPVPSLVQHPDVEPSLIGRRAAAGRNRARVAALAFPEQV